MWEILRPAGQMRLLLAEQHDGGQTRLLAGSVFLMLGETVFYAFNGCWRWAMPLRANDVIQWEAIHDAVVNGFRHYDLGEVEEQQEGLHEFKGKWGAQASRLYRYYDPAADIRPGESESRGQRRVAKIAWQRMPASLTALLGDKLYGYM
jgi:lipid II:glycine glycyltransferase (peptidoglycan interpeptide bridge formation enzyme)